MASRLHVYLSVRVNMPSSISQVVKTELRENPRPRKVTFWVWHGYLHAERYRCSHVFLVFIYITLIPFASGASKTHH